MQVDCAPSPDTGNPEPAALWFGARRVAVRAVTDRWWGREQRWWKVDTAEGAYIVRRDERTQRWDLAAVVGADPG